MKTYSVFSFVSVAAFSIAAMPTKGSDSTRRPVDAIGVECGSVARNLLTSTAEYVAWNVTNGCEKAIYIEGHIGKYPIGTIINGKETKEVGCIRTSVDCGVGILEYSFRWN
jgi:hypothetical protein